MAKGNKQATGRPKMTEEEKKQQAERRAALKTADSFEGRRRKFKKSDLDQLESLSGYHTSHKSISLLMDFPERDFDLYLKHDKLFSKSYWMGKAKTEVNVKQLVYQDAIKGNKKSAEFILTTKFGYNESQNITLTGADGGPIEFLKKLDVKSLTTEELETLKSVLQKQIQG